MSKDLPASVRERLLNIAKSERADFNQVLVRFALERILYRLSVSDHANRFLLKGALLFTLWYQASHRPTRDADLLGFGPSDLNSVAQAFREIATVKVDDGILFDPETVVVEEIRKDAGYVGVRVLIWGDLAKARCRAQIDVGFGDAVTPAPVQAIYPVMLKDLPAPHLRTYPIYTVVSEKIHAITTLGMTNSRVKDYWDLWTLLDRETLDSDTLTRAISATFKRRGTSVLTDLPVGLTDEFANDTSRQALWVAFLKKNQLAAFPLIDIVTRLRTILGPAIREAATVEDSPDSTVSAQQDSWAPK
jgi:hypothetical protein